MPSLGYAGRSALSPAGAAPRRRPGSARGPGLPWPDQPPPAIGYHVYSNTGAGEAINYGSIIATVYALTYTTGPLSYPADWKFGVRAFYTGNGLEEKNLDAAVEIILDASGHDITNRPAPPTGLRAFPIAHG
jgi:hypothetical protein